MKRLITDHDQSGESVFVNEGELPRQLAHAAGGFGITQVWATEEVPVLPAPGGDPALERHQFFPGHGGTRFLIARFPPTAASQEFFAHFPGLAELMEPVNPGMHASHTVDYGVALSGEVDLELDYGVVKRLKAGDCYVQNGTRHAWRNPGDGDCIVAVAVGARARR